MLELRGVSIDRGGRRVVDGVDLQLHPGEHLGLLGVSGSGKSSLLKLAAGLLAPSRGSYRNDFAHPLLVFQTPRLLPWRRVRANVEIPLRAAGCSAAGARRRAGEWLERVGLGAQADAWPGQLSGG
ncbi:MAG: ATP-binding cassette domain-containing protein, partial [Microvirgula sp.]